MKCHHDRVTNDLELPPDPDLDDLPPELAEAEGPLKIVGVDEHGNVWESATTKEELGPAFADARRAAEDDDA